MSERVAGRELDAEVAEKVMGDVGWDIVIEGCSRVGRYFETRDEAAAYRETIRDKWHVGPVVLHGDVPRYSDDIAAAWQVVEKVWKRLPKPGYGTYRFQLNRRDSDGAYVCEFAPDADGDWRTHATGTADTAPLAICLAALKAVGATEPTEQEAYTRQGEQA